jgi:hypothetical protein
MMPWTPISGVDTNESAVHRGQVGQPDEPARADDQGLHDEGRPDEHARDARDPVREALAQPPRDHRGLA